jgi:hypothetical protein
VQYFVWPAPFLLIAAPRAFLAVTAACTLVQVTFYHTTASSGFPWMLSIPREEHLPLWSAIGTICWGTFVAVLVVYAREWWKKTEQEDAAMRQAAPTISADEPALRN